VTGGKIAAGAVGGTYIADGAVSGTKIANGAVGAGNVASGAITASKLGTITTIEHTVEVPANTITLVGENCGTGTLLSEGSDDTEVP
jgi:trimeric autotransporter adhesin